MMEGTRVGWPADEETRLVMAELGFSSRGIRIEAAIRRAQGAANVLDKAGHR